MTRLGGLLLALVLCAGLPACSGSSGPDPRPTAEAWATALTTGDLADVPVADPPSGGVAKGYAAIVEGLGGLEPRVEVASVDDGASDAERIARLRWTWPVGGSWAYETSLPLREVDGAWRGVWSPAVVEGSLQAGETLRLQRLTPTRGDLLGAGGTALVTERPVVRFGLDKTRVSAARAPASARRLATLLDVDVAGFVKQVRAAGAKAYVEAIVYRRDDVPRRVAAGYEAIPGAVATKDQLALAPSKGFAAPILGTVGQVTAEMVKKQPDVYRPGDQAGLSGLQARYDEQLRGTPGALVTAVPGDGAPGGAETEPRELFRVDPKAGRDLRLSLDVRLQQQAESVLAGVRPDAALVAIRPSTGAVLAAATGPSSSLNLATFGRFAPGSTFKIASSLALLRAGLRLGSAVTCPASVTVDGKRFGNYSDYPSGALGRITLAQAVANSCNTAFIGQRGRVDGSALADAAASLGVGIDHDAGFPAYFGAVPEPRSQTEAAADLIGQGTVTTSPMAVATLMASVQAGRTVLPWLVQDQCPTVGDGVAPLTSGEVTALRSLLRGVVTGGSGRGLGDLPGPPVRAKTGTAEFERDGRTLTHAWMVAGQGDLAAAVFVDVGDSGSGTAGPLLRRFLASAR
ncbi:penicillin-binding protein [Nocardioides sp. TRM66260-LWL]|uniref:penicillin-binding transpeptidase domain-containing protein n=1 Tax=Nocardioides sp. TRM66260-LWL TaxID=2874478 RepID=UPI001CC7AF89|nr:penicillin-binding transpeptidase domain-containing protein [Nocardioides sp. TRM66260-LWL]MBZ5735459.1 penicillin-binding protein [Nocardioides sp. TRM66260-LWL]